MKKKCILYLFLLIILTNTQTSFAAINVDRTRIIFSGQKKSVSLVVNNQHKTLPYLAQSWIEDEEGNKVSEPFMVLPFIQRVEANAKNQLKITKTHGLDKLPQDRESLFYFNVREIPPISEKENIMQIAIQSRLKIFYRPTQIENNSDKAWAEHLKYTHYKEHILIENPTRYYITLGYLSNNLKNNFSGFNSIMIAPMSKLSVNIPNIIPSQLYVGYIDDYGGLKMLDYDCNQVDCQLNREIK